MNLYSLSAGKVLRKEGRALGPWRTSSDGEDLKGCRECYEWDIGVLANSPFVPFDRAHIVVRECSVQCRK
jgi:hypothetical protein